MSDDLATIGYAFARDKGVLVLPERDRLTVGVREGANPLHLLEVRRALGRAFEIERLSPEAFARQLPLAYARTEFAEEDEAAALAGQDDLASLAEGIHQTADLLDGDDDAPVIRLINGLIYEAINRGASDIHIEPNEDELSIRYRIDGVLLKILSPSRRLATPLVSRIKVMARLDIAERRVPQDGRIALTVGGRAVDVRVSTLPSRYGERVVLRILDKARAHMSLEDLGMPSEILARFRKALAEPNGVILVTGPTGSGKTTSLYSALSILNDGQRSILTIEDPIEYGLDGIGQTQVNDKVGMTFAAGLRAILRQDPDVVMVGEVRDVETAQIAARASLAGRLVLSTVHTNSAASAITRLRDMGVESYLLSSTLRAVLAQRLVRKLCPDCKEAYTPDAAEREAAGIAPDADVTFWRAHGCASCGRTGYLGRIGIYEMMIVDRGLRDLIHEDVDERTLEKRAFAEHGMLFESGMARVMAGETSLDEVIRVSRREGEDNADI
ncbi:MAG: type II secretion system ATPase GspE [Pseudomonadota bacterium]